MKESNTKINNELDICSICLDIIINNEKKDLNIVHDISHVYNKIIEEIKNIIITQYYIYIDILNDINYDNYEILECSHKFHKKCINEWKKKNNICPLCRNIINTDKYNCKYNEFKDDQYNELYRNRVIINYSANFTIIIIVMVLIQYYNLLSSYNNLIKIN